MVFLVRCFDDTFALALESRLDQLKNQGLISAVLRDGIWIDVKPEPGSSLPQKAKRRSRMTATVAFSRALVY